MVGMCVIYTYSAAPACWVKSGLPRHVPVRVRVRVWDRSPDAHGVCQVPVVVVVVGVVLCDAKEKC
jgi:hypothetical protein